MALLKASSYGNWEFDLGDTSLADELKDQLKATPAEIAAAVNEANLAKKLLGQLLENRSRAHKTLLNQLPKVVGAGHGREQ